MLDKVMLEHAASQGIIRRDQIEPLYNFACTYEASPDAFKISHESARFVRSLGDVFVTLGIVILSIALSFFAKDGFARIIVLAVLFGLSEWIVGKRKLVLPGMALLISIMWFASGIVKGGEHGWLISMGVAVAASAIFFLRHKMPFAIASTAVGLVIFLVALLSPTLGKESIPYITGFSGLVFFMLAMFFDAKDTVRVTRYSDTAFWLHLISAPLMTHSLLLSVVVGHTGIDGPGVGSALFILVFFGFVTLLALFIDRRPIIVSNLLYVIFAVVQLLPGDTMQKMGNIGFVILVFGVFTIVLGVNWYRIRTAIFAKMVDHPLARYVPSFTLRK